MAFRTNKTPVLQMKSASGSVTTFNTALAMPLASCNISVNAWQEGSGDPSPDNVRPIHGFNVLNATRAGKNLLDKRLLIQSPAVTQPYLCKFGVDNYNTRVPNGSIILASGQYTFSCIDKNDSSKNNTQLSIYDENGNNLYTRYTVKSMTFTVPKSMAVSFSINCGASSFTTWDDYEIQLEVGNTKTSFEPYTGNTYPIQLGQEVYGGYVDVVNGVAHVTHSILTLDGSEDWQPYQIQGRYYANDVIERRSNLVSISGYLCDSYVFRGNGDTASSGVSVDKSVYMQATYGRVWIYDTDFETAEDLISYLSTHNVAVVYPLATPFDIQLTPTQIETLIGNNTIFADTGDIDLTYKDLDIAKRGNFREVFRLPS